MISFSSLKLDCINTEYLHKGREPGKKMPWSKNSDHRKNVLTEPLFAKCMLKTFKMLTH